MASTQQKIQAEQQMRKLLEEQGLAQPDEVEYGETCIRLFWHVAQRMVVIQIDEPPPGWRFAEELTDDERERVRRGEALDGEDDLDW